MTRPANSNIHPGPWPERKPIPRRAMLEEVLILGELGIFVAMLISAVRP